MISRISSFGKTIRGKILVYTGLILIFLLVSVIAMHTRDMYSHLLLDNQENLVLNASKAALEIEKSNLNAVKYAESMALAQESGLFGKRGESVKYLYAVVGNNPQLFDAYTIYEPNADGQDEKSRGMPGSDASGRFNANVTNVNGKLDLINGVDMETSLYYQGVKEKFLSGGEDKYMVTEPYVYEGVMMVEQTYPVVIDGKFAGITGVDRTLGYLSDYLSHLKPYESADFVLISRLGGVISATMDPKLNTRKIAETPYKDVLKHYYGARAGKGVKEVTVARDPIDGEDYFYAGAPVKTGDWTLVMRVSRDEILQPIRRTLLRTVLVAVAGLLITFAVLVWITDSIATPIRISVQAAKKVASGDLTSRIEASAVDETGELLIAIGDMTRSLNGLIGQVQRSCIQVSSSASEIASSAVELEATLAEQAASTNEVSATAAEISGTARDLVQTMTEVNDGAAEAAEMADSGRVGLVDMERAMRGLVESTGSISAKLAVINEKANNISGIVTTISKVADQTNLLSLNASIEAEKAGEAGLGFSVVAREIRRLADQTAVATLDIESMVKEMQAAVSQGVMGMDKFSQDIRGGMKEVGRISAQLEEVIVQVQALIPRFASVNEGMQSQFTAAQQISEAIIHLNDAAQQTSGSVSEFNGATEQLNEAVNGLREEVSRFKVTG